ncbi:MAG: efflux RND transporter periplasmic adaptor subunit, partial [Candidatus Eremiobacteraeota bacterium]|nr:efflux RND transporter periplasmic adaptor subunit [Candidatus Eremiobacteraeota bacterium]
LSTVWVLASVFPDNLRDVAVGETADVVTDASPTPLTGRVAYIASLVDSASNAVSVRLLVPNRGLLLRRGMFVRVGIHAARERTDILVPVSAVLRDEQNLPFVFVAAPDGSFGRRRVTLGQQVGEQYALRAGLTSGDQVVAEGALFLQFAETQ